MTPKWQLAQLAKGLLREGHGRLRGRALVLSKGAPGCVNSGRGQRNEGGCGGLGGTQGRRGADVVGNQWCVSVSWGLRSPSGNRKGAQRNQGPAQSQEGSWDQPPPASEP